jgi:Stage II sporulation protein E (SpoIIE)
MLRDYIGRGAAPFAGACPTSARRWQMWVVPWIFHEISAPLVGLRIGIRHQGAPVCDACCRQALARREVRILERRPVPPLLLARDGIRRLTMGGPVLGALTESSFEDESLLLKPQDTVTLFSDGVTEALDSTGREFGDERLISCASELLTHSASEVLQGILSAAGFFARHHPCRRHDRRRY